MIFALNPKYHAKTNRRYIFKKDDGAYLIFCNLLELHIAGGHHVPCKHMVQSAIAGGPKPGISYHSSFSRDDRILTYLGCRHANGI